MRYNGLDSALLGVVRSERERRSAPAVVALSRTRNPIRRAEKRGGAVDRLRNHIGAIHRAAKLSLGFQNLADGLFILPGSGHKIDEVRAELVHAGISETKMSQFSTLGGESRGLLSLVRYVGAFIFAGAVRLTLAARLSPASRSYLDVIFGFSWLRRLLRKSQTTGFWVIIGDLSPFLICLSASLREENGRFVSWQYGYQDFKRFPARPDLAVVLNQKGMDLARVGRPSPDIPVFQRQTIDPVAIRFPVERHGVVGVVLNAFSMPDVLNELVQIQKHLRCRIIVRPHPRDTNMSGKQLPDEIDICKADTLEEFCSRVDWVICGNTTSALKIVGNGFPVCQYFGFDLFFDDHFEYGKMGLMPTFKTVDSLSEEAVMRFFAKVSALQSLRKIFGRTDMSSVLPLTELRSYLEGPGAPGFE